MVNEIYCPKCDLKTKPNAYDKALEVEASPQIQFSRFVAGDILVRTCPDCMAKDIVQWLPRL